MAGAAIMTLSFATACGTSGSTAAPPAANPAPVSAASLVAGSKSENSPGHLRQRREPTAKLFTDAFQKAYPWIKVTSYDLDDPVIFSRYAAEHAPAATPPTSSSQRPEPVDRAVKKGYVQNYTPADITDFPAFAAQGSGLYIMSPDPAVTIYNKKLLGGQAPPATVAAIAQGAATGKYKVATYAINNDFGYAAFLWLRATLRLADPRPTRQTAKTPGDGDVLATDVAQGGFTTAVFESGLVRGAIKAGQPRRGLGIHHRLHPAHPARHRDHHRRGAPERGESCS